MAQEPEFIPADECGEVLFASMGTDPPLNIMARWRKHRIVYHGGWGDPEATLWTLWLEGKPFKVINEKSGMPAERFYLPDRFRGGSGSLKGKKVGELMWKVDYTAYHAVPTGEESAGTTERLTFNLGTMEAYYAILKVQMYD